MKFSYTVLLGVALYLLSPAEAGISTNTPFNAIIWNGGETEKVVWVDDGKAPKLAEIGITSVDLMKGDSTTQTLVANIGKVPATAKQVEYKVPKDVGPPGSDYFIKYTAGTYTAFSGTFSIEDVNGEAPAPAPAPGVPGVPGIPGVPGAPAPAPAPAGLPTDPNTPKTTDPTTAPITAPNTAPKVTDPNATDSKAPSGSPKSTSSAAAAATNTLPEPISSDSNLLFPSFSGVAAAAIAFAFTYLY